jgi:hypothetical protein
MYGLDVMGGLIAGEGVVVTGPGRPGLWAWVSPTYRVRHRQS